MILIAAIAVSLIAAVVGSAKAEGPSYDYCVACAGPAATYLCTVGPREPDPGAGAWASYCTERVRGDMGHASCSAQPLGQDCRATRAFVFRGARATPKQAEALRSDIAEERRSAATEIWSQTLEGMRNVGETVGESAGVVGRRVEESAEVVGDAAQSVGEEVWYSLKALGRTMSRGTDCVISMGDRC